MKYILLSCLVANILVGMNHKAKYHADGKHYALAGDPLEYRRINKTMYPLFIKQKGSDDKLQAWFNCDKPIKWINWDAGGEYVVRVGVATGEQYEFDLKFLHNLNYVQKLNSRNK